MNLFSFDESKGGEKGVNLYLIGKPEINLLEQCNTANLI